MSAQIDVLGERGQEVKLLLAGSCVDIKPD